MVGPEGTADAFNVVPEEFACAGDDIWVLEDFRPLYGFGARAVSSIEFAEALWPPGKAVLKKYRMPREEVVEEENGRTHNFLFPPREQEVVGAPPSAAVSSLLEGIVPSRPPSSPPHQQHKSQSHHVRKTLLRSKSADAAARGMQQARRREQKQTAGKTRVEDACSRPEGPLVLAAQTARRFICASRCGHRRSGEDSGDRCFERWSPVGWLVGVVVRYCTDALYAVTK